MAKKLWGGRFKKEIDKDFFEFQKSIQYDYKLAEYDVMHSLIHISALKNSKILDKKEFVKLKSALLEIYR
ncbi:MAG: argininosuccinate lyase, partial [Candidatus Omnitrophota bacterium]